MVPDWPIYKSTVFLRSVRRHRIQLGLHRGHHTLTTGVSDVSAVIEGRERVVFEKAIRVENRYVQLLPLHSGVAN